MGEMEKMEPLLLAVEQASAALVRSLQDAINATPSDEWANGVRYMLDKAITSARNAGTHIPGVRTNLVERDRPKGLDVMICLPSRNGPSVTTKEELAEVTSGSFVMRNGHRYSRKTGKRIGSYDRWTGVPCITEEERARVLALRWKPGVVKGRVD